MEKVSEDTIAGLTKRAAPLSAAEAGPPPAAQQMIDQIRASLTLKIKALANSAAAREAEAEVNPHGVQDLPSAFEIALVKSVNDLQKFEDIVANVPEGFRLAPVLYSQIKQYQNNTVLNEFKSTVRPKFLQYLAENHSAELAALGICPQGIDLMREGHNPVDPIGRTYDVSIDHIIERSGGGTISRVKDEDPMMPAGSADTFRVNHFGNLILLPGDVHTLKNKLNTLQSLHRTLPGESQWALMLVPEAPGPEYSGYVARPQAQPLSTQKEKITPLNALQNAVGTILKPENVIENPAQEEFLQPAIDDITGLLTQAFNDVCVLGRKVESFMQFYQGPKFTRLRQKMKALPEERTAEFFDTVSRIDETIKDRFNEHARRPVTNTHHKRKQKPPQPQHRSGKRRRHDK